MMMSPVALVAANIELPKLPYDSKSLDPVISARTMEFHYGKHHAGYVNNLNKLIVGTPYEKMSLEQIVKESDVNKATAIFNNAAQTWNHTFYFESLRSQDQAVQAIPLPTTGGKLRDAIVARWGSMEVFMKEFETAGAGVFV